MSNSNQKYVRDVVMIVPALAAMGIRINDLPEMLGLDNLVIAKFSDICNQVDQMVAKDDTLVRNSFRSMVLDIIAGAAEAESPKTKYTEAEMAAHLAVMASTNTEYSAEDMNFSSSELTIISQKILEMARDESNEFKQELLAFAEKQIKRAL